jgi:lipopolysaccharide transport system permease protein
MQMGWRMDSRTLWAQPAAVFTCLWRHRHLVWQMSKREIQIRYRGSLFGGAWTLLQPLAMLAVYTFVFGVVLKARAGGVPEFAVFLFTGLSVFAVFAECINRAPNLVLGNVNYVKKVVFPLEVLPWVALLPAMFQLLINLVVLLVFRAGLHGAVPWTVVFIPVVVLPLVLIVLGLSWFLASLAVYLRDVRQVVGVFTTMVMFLSAIFYPTSSLPPKAQTLMALNPLAFIVEQARATLLWGQWPEWGAWAAWMVLALLFAWFGLSWFEKTRRGFADVI